MTETSSIQERYHTESKIAADKTAQLDKKINRTSMLRLLLIIVGAIMIFNAVQTESIGLTLFAALSVLLSFFYLVFVQSRLEKRRKDWVDYGKVRENELAIFEGKENMYANGIEFEEAKHHYAQDLDVFGPSSLYSYTNRCSSPEGKRVLAHWFAAAGHVAEVKERQGLVQEVSTDVAWYQEIQAKLLFNLKENLSYGELINNNLSNSSYDFGNKALRIYVAAAPFISGTVIFMAFFFNIFVNVTIWLAIIHLMLAMGYSGHVTKLSQGLSKTSQGLQYFAHVFAMIEDRDWQSVLGKRLQGSFSTGGHSTSAAIKALGTLLEKIDYRLNILVGAFMNALFLWDLKQAFALVDWRKRQHEHIQGAFDAFGQFEALISLAALRVNHPSWTFPNVLDTEEKHLEVVGLGHPLIKAEKSIANDYAMNGHRLALITGSNMAGKSTFLRTIGTNMVLAMTGGPVCATRMSLSRQQPVTYMRIKDNLNESTSTFKAELDRLQMILHQVEIRDDVFFLIDEMLRGTNSMDKYLGSKAVIERLIEMKGIGMVATHDLQLAELSEKYPVQLMNYHFDIQVQQGEMLFDYKLKEGPCTIFNASLLLKRIGIHIGDTEINGKTKEA